MSSSTNDTKSVTILPSMVDFRANISIVNASPITKQMQSNLPDNYTRSQNSGIFSLLYGTGYEFERLKQTFKQLEANNYLYSPDVQNETISIDGKGKYLIEFAVPFVTPPLNVSVLASSYTDVFIEFTSRFGMIINVSTDQSDVVEWHAYGFVGAATDKYLGDALYQNFGSQFGFKRQGDSEIDTSIVSVYEKNSTFINVENIISFYNFNSISFSDGTVRSLSGSTITEPISSLLSTTRNAQISANLNQPPVGIPYLTGFIKPTTVRTTPPSTHELVDVNGFLVALLDCSTIGPSVTSYYSSVGNAKLPLVIPNNLNIPSSEVKMVYINGFASKYNFDAYHQSAFLQEIFRADNKYRRLLAGINLSLIEGPSTKGLANIVETLFSQPYIPYSIWNESDYRIFKNSVNSDVALSPVSLDTPKFQTTLGYASQYETYPASPPVVEILRVTKDWNPDTINFNNQPPFEAADNVASDSTGVTQRVTSLNTATQFDLTAEIVRQLRLGISAAPGGVVDWNYGRVYSDLSATFAPFLPYEGDASTKPYPYFFLNSSSDSYAGIQLFYYAINLNFNKKPIGYAPAYGPLKINQDYFIEPLGQPLADPLNPGSLGYNIPSEMLQNFAADSNVPFVTSVIPDGINIVTGTDGKNYWKGTRGLSNLKQPPQFYIQLKLNRYNQIHNGIDAAFPTSANNFIVYSYEPVTIAGTRINGNFGISSDFNGNRVVQYYDADSKITNPPIDTPFMDGGEFKSTALAQTSFAKFTLSTSYNYICTMLGGTVEFSKTIIVNNLISRKAINDSSTSSPVFFNILGIGLNRSSEYHQLNPQIENPVYHREGTSQFSVEGTFAKMRDVINGQPILRSQLEYGKYCLLDDNGAILTIIQDTSPAYAKFGTFSNLLNAGILGQKMVVTGPVYNTIWDTRMPVNSYLTDSPVFQATANFDSPVTTFVPDQTSLPTPLNNNFLVILDGLPGGIQEDIKAFWSFNITRTPVLGETVRGVLGFSDIYLGDNSIQRGIMSLFCGIDSSMSKYVQSGTKTISSLTVDTITSSLQSVSATYVDVDAAYYAQSYTSPNFTGYFLNYKDYVKELTVANSGSSLQITGDKNLNDTLTFSFNKKTFSAKDYANHNTTLNFFSPKFGFVSLSILPNMFFNNAISGTPIEIVRPNNHGLAVRIQGDSHAGLVFYGKNQIKVVDKPTRLIVNYSYSIASRPTSSKIVEIEDGGFANWVSASDPEKTYEADIFFVSGNQFKYAHHSFDQATDTLNNYQFTDKISNNNVLVGSGNLPTNISQDGSLYYSITPKNAIPPIFEVDDDPLIPKSLKRPFSNGQAGPPFRYRKAVSYSSLQSAPQIAPQNYTNISAEKIAYIQFDLSSFPFDTVINKAILEIYFASGFTIKQGKDTNFTLNDNRSWEKSRLSGNGLTFQDEHQVLRPLNNVHWRKNYFEIIVPYAFVSEPQDFNYGIRALFGQSNSIVPAPVNPQPNLEYLGFVNIDEIDTTKLYTRSNLHEETVGLANIILTKSSIIFQTNGVLTFNQSGPNQKFLGLDNVQNQSIQYLNNVLDPSGLYLDNAGNTITPIFSQQREILPNQKILLFPYGLQSDFFLYGYVKSILASSFIGFTPNDIAIYQQALSYVTPIYTQYNVKLLEADTYFPYTTFGRETTIADTTQDISF